MIKHESSKTSIHVDVTNTIRNLIGVEADKKGKPMQWPNIREKENGKRTKRHTCRVDRHRLNYQERDRRCRNKAQEIPEELWASDFPYSSQARLFGVFTSQSNRKQNDPPPTIFRQIFQSPAMPLPVENVAYQTGSSLLQTRRYINPIEIMGGPWIQVSPQPVERSESACAVASK